MTLTTRTAAGAIGRLRVIMQPTSTILTSLAEEATEKVTLGDVLDKTGSRAHGLGLFVFVLPETVPLPTPSLSTFLSIPLVLISAHLTAFGEGSGIPNWVRRREIRASIVRKVADYVAPVIERIERLSRPRLLALVQRERLLGVLCLLLAIILALPIPLANFLPALCLAAIAFGMLQRDGVIIGLGIVGCVGVLISLYFGADAIMKLLK
jgi:hypothetical protein